MSKWKRLQRRTVSVKNTSVHWNCIDCGVNTAPGFPTREKLERDFAEKGNSPMRIGAQSEVYTVHDHVWKAAGMEVWGGCLCIGCLERRLGRRLIPADFPLDHPFNLAPGTPRLLERQGRAYGLPDYEDNRAQ
jgi:hypothetical protein